MKRHDKVKESAWMCLHAWFHSLTVKSIVHATLIRLLIKNLAKLSQSLEKDGLELNSKTKRNKNLCFDVVLVVLYKSVPVSTGHWVSVPFTEECWNEWSGDAAHLSCVYPWSGLQHSISVFTSHVSDLLPHSNWSSCSEARYRVSDGEWRKAKTKPKTNTYLLWVEILQVMQRKDRLESFPKGLKLSRHSFI